MKNTSLFLFSLLWLLSATTLAQSPFEAFRENGLWGFKKGKKIILAPHYQHISYDKQAPFLSVQSNNKYALYDTTGKQMTAHLFDFYVPYHPDYLLLRVSIEGKSGFIDNEGNLVIPPLYDRALNFLPNTQFVLVCIDEKYTFINRKGEAISPFHYDSADNYFDEHGLARVSREGYSGFINTKGEEFLVAKASLLKHIPSYIHNLTQLKNLYEKRLSCVQSQKISAEEAKAMVLQYLKDKNIYASEVYLNEYKGKCCWEVKAISYQANHQKKYRHYNGVTIANTYYYKIDLQTLKIRSRRKTTTIYPNFE